MMADHATVQRLLKTARGQLDGILKMVEEDGEEILLTINDEAEFDAVWQAFEDRLSDEYEIIN